LQAAVVDGDTREVAGHEVGRELHARELQAEAVGQSMGQRGFAHAGHVLDQQMSPGQQAGDTIPDLIRFAFHYRVKLT